MNEILSDVFSWPVVIQTLCDCKLHLVATAQLSNMFFSERQLMTSSLVLLQSKVWLSAPRYQVWDEPETRWTRDNVQRHGTFYATKSKPFSHSDIIISLTNDWSKVLIKRLSGLYCIIRLFVTSSRCWATSPPLRKRKATLPLQLKHYDLWYQWTSW